MGLSEAGRQKERLVEFDYLRGLAIVMIVLGHSIFLAQPVFPLLLENLLRGGTGLFVFISGFFFHRVFYARFDYKKFISKKASALLYPFLTISLVALSIRMFGWWQDGLDWQQNLLNSWYTIRNGYVLYPHWYIPFILLTFLCSPLHLAYIRAPLSMKLAVLVIFSFIAVFMHRPESNSNFLQSLIYFTPYYLLGILVSQYEQPLRIWHWQLLILGVLVVAATALAQTYLWVHIGNYHAQAFHYDGWDLQFIQNLFGCIAMLALCRHINWPWLQQHLRWLAELSFPIFFIHPLLTIALENIATINNIKPFFPVDNIPQSLLVFAVVFLVQLYGSAAIAQSIRQLFPSVGHRFIG
ncbi:MAG: acyltransferase [Cellvibrio sp.]|uniref:acyltransferase n=1 Tax=Cellvibrio sp. TaxID=1965322 RepID=UPI0031A65C95